MKNLLLLTLCLATFGCGTTLRDYVEPTFPVAETACYVAQTRAVERSDSRAEAEALVERIREACDIGYAGLEALLEIDDYIELNREPDTEEPEESPEDTDASEDDEVVVPTTSLDNV
jgi:hypothetical protein